MSATDETDAVEGRFPDFHIVGAAKCGTTTLAAYLARHPGVHLSRRKEPEFFAKGSPVAADTEHYKNLFSNSLGKLAGEASTIYSRAPHFEGVPGRIAQATPNAKIIYIVREPVYRAHADCAMVQRFWYNTHREQRFSPSFEEAIGSSDPLMNSVIDTGRFHFQLSQYLECFPRENIYVVDMDSLVTSPRTVLPPVLRFLGAVEPADDDFYTELRKNRRHDFEAKTRRARLRRFLSRLPLAGMLRNVLPDSAKEFVYTAMQDRVSLADVTLPPMQESTFLRLRDFYADDSRLLARDFGIDTERWSRLSYEQYVSQCR